MSNSKVLSYCFSYYGNNAENRIINIYSHIGTNRIYYMSFYYVDLNF